MGVLQPEAHNNGLKKKNNCNSDRVFPNLERFVSFVGRSSVDPFILSLLSDLGHYQSRDPYTFCFCSIVSRPSHGPASLSLYKASAFLQDSG